MESSEQIDAEIQNILSAPDATYWLKAALQAALARDCVDAAVDAELLARVLSRRCEAKLEGR